MFAPAMRNIWPSLICQDAFMRHALRATCTTLRAWLPKDEVFVERIRLLIGHTFNLPNGGDTLVIEALMRNVLDEYHDAKIGQPILEQGHDALMYMFDANKFPTSLFGQVNRLDILSTIHDMYHTYHYTEELYHLLGREAFNALFCWSIAWNPEKQQVVLYRYNGDDPFL